MWKLDIIFIFFYLSVCSIWPVVQFSRNQKFVISYRWIRLNRRKSRKTVNYHLIIFLPYWYEISCMFQQRCCVGHALQLPERYQFVISSKIIAQAVMYINILIQHLFLAAEIDSNAYIRKWINRWLLIKWFWVLNDTFSSSCLIFSNNAKIVNTSTKSTAKIGGEEFNICDF